MSCALASVTTPMTTTQIQTLQPKIVVDETKMATATAILSSNDANVVSCNINVADVTSVMDANAMQSQNVVSQVPVPTHSTGAEPKFTPNLGQTETKVLLPAEPKSDEFLSTGHPGVLVNTLSTTPKLPLEQLQVVPIQQAPTVIVRPPTAPKSYSGATSYKAYKEYFERLSICNGWSSNLVKAQNLLINLDGAAAEAVRGLEVTSEADYDKIWEMLKRRFSLQDDIEQS